MGCKAEKSHPYFKQKALKDLSEQHLAGDLVEKDTLAIPTEHSNAQARLSMLASYKNAKL